MDRPATGDIEAGRVTGAGISLSGNALLTSAEARQAARHLIAAAEELDGLSDLGWKIGA